MESADVPDDRATDEPTTENEIGPREDAHDPGETILLLRTSKVLDFIVDSASKRAHDSVQADRRTSAARWTLIVGALAALGLGGLAAGGPALLRVIVKEEVGTTVSREVESHTNPLRAEYDRLFEDLAARNRVEIDASVATIGKILEDKVAAGLEESKTARDDLREEMRWEGEYQQLAYMALALDLKEGFSDDERDVVLDLLGRISKRPSQLARPEFATHIVAVVESFAMADLGDHLLDIHDLLGPVLVDSRKSAVIMATALGQHLMGTAGASAELQREASTFAEYARAARKHRYPEVAVFWELLVALRASDGSRTDVTDALIQQAARLGEQDRSRFVGYVVQYGDWTNWTSVRRCQSDQVQLAVEHMVNAYEAELTDMGAAR